MTLHTEKLSLRLSTHHCDNAYGATIVEFSIAIGVFFILIIGFIDFSRYMQLQGVLNAAANRALQLAEIMPGIETAFSADDSEYQQSRTYIIDHARTVVLSTAPESNTAMQYFDRVDLTLPSTRLGEPYELTLQNNPINVEVAANFKFFLPMFFNQEFEVVGQASGFRERRYVLSNPIPVDCMGNPRSSPTFGVWCNCPEGLSYNFSTSSCESCPEGRIIRNGSCVCDDSVPCDGGQFRNSQTCQCTCSFTNANGLPLNGQIWDEEADSCVCDPSVSELGGDGLCHCSDEASCTGGMVRLVYNSCACGCDVNTRPGTAPDGSAICVPLSCEGRENSERCTWDWSARTCDCSE